MSVTAMLAWGIVLMAAALLLVVLEIFIPSAGLISIVAGMIGIAGIVCLFQESASWGWAGVLTAIVLVPTIFTFGFKIMPSTSLGKRLLFGEGEKHEPVIPESQGNEFEALLGAEGEAVTDLRPVGMARIDGVKIDVSSEVSFVPAGAKIRVTSVAGSQIKVRPIA